MMRSYNLIEHEDVHGLLAVAKRHLGYITRSGSKEIRIPVLKVQHSIVATIFCSAAVEAALNLFIVVPVLYIQPDDLRRFFGRLAQKYKRLNVRSKLQFARTFFPADKETKRLFDDVCRLFDDRNSLIHASSDFEEVPVVKDCDELPANISPNDLVLRPQLTSLGHASNDVSQAFKNYRVACAFIKKLSEKEVQSFSSGAK